MRGNGYERKRASGRSGGPNEPPGTGYGGREKASERASEGREIARGGRAGVGERQLKIGSGDSGGPTLVHRVIDERNTSFLSCCEREGCRRRPGERGEEYLLRQRPRRHRPRANNSAHPPCEGRARHTQTGRKGTNEKARRAGRSNRAPIAKEALSSAVAVIARLPRIQICPRQCRLSSTREEEKRRQHRIGPLSISC